jgi:hypothetical protein
VLLFQIRVENLIRPTKRWEVQNFLLKFYCDNSVTLGSTQLEQAGSALCVLHTRRFALWVQFRLLFCAEWRTRRSLRHSILQLNAWIKWELANWYWEGATENELSERSSKAMAVHVLNSLHMLDVHRMSRATRNPNTSGGYFLRCDQHTFL